MPRYLMPPCAAILLLAQSVVAAEPNAFAPYRAIADRIIAAAKTDPGAYDKLVALCDDIGHRLSGSAQLSQAIDWSQAVMKADGLQNVHAEPVQVPKWVRGEESLEMLQPRGLKLPMLGLGNSVGTVAAGVTAEVVVVKDETELATLGELVHGKVVLFNNRMAKWTEVKGSQYGESVRFRSGGADLAAKLGAVAVLVRSVTARSLSSPHTGALRYAGAIKLPAAAVTVETAEMLSRFYSRGIKIQVKLSMQAHMDGLAPSANVIGELRGRDKPDEIVIISGHLDSWDVGQGAHDDGAGVVSAMQALAMLQKMGLQPRRTIRVVLWTNEENGLAGAKQYVVDHKAEMSKHVAAIESDAGAFRPTGMGIAMKEKNREQRAEQRLNQLVQLWNIFGKQEVKRDAAGADVGQMQPFDVPTMELLVHNPKYFDYHHSQADTVDKVKPVDLQADTAALAIAAYVLAEMPGRLDDAPSK